MTSIPVRFSIRTKLEIILLIPVIVFGLFLGVMSLIEYQFYHTHSDRVLGDLETEISGFHGLGVALHRMAMPVDNYLVTGEPEYVKEFEGMDRELMKLFDRVDLAVRHPEDRIVLKRARSMYQDVHDLSHPLFGIARPVGDPRAIALMKEIDGKSDSAARMISGLSEEHGRMSEDFRNEAHELRQKIMAVGATGGIVTLLLILFYGIYHGRRFTRPILALERYVNAIGDGDYTVTVPPGTLTGDEVETLARGIDRMRVKIRTTLDFVEEKVRERTRELEASREDLSKLAGILERGKREWEATFDAISDLISIHDGDFNIVRVNRALADRLGVEPRDLIGKKCFQILCGREEPLDDCPDVRTMRSHLPAFLEQEQTVLGGVYQVSTYPLVTHDGNFWGTVQVARDVTELKKVDERIRKEAEISSSLLQVSDALTASLDLPTLFSKVTEISCRMIGTDHSAVFLWSGDEQAFIPQAVHGLPGELLPEFRACRFRPLDFPCFGDILRTGGPVSIPDCSRSDLISPEFAGHFRIGSLHVTPIMRRGEVIGALQTGQTEGPREWTSKEVDLINGMTHQLAVMIDNARLYRQMVEKSLELSRHLETMTVMHEIDLAVLSKLDQEEILEEVTHRVRRLVPADRVTLVTVDPQRECFRYVAGFGVDVPKGEEVPFHETDAAEVVRRRAAIVRSDLSHESNLLPLDRMLHDRGFRSDIRIPLFQKEEVSALLNVGSFRSGAFTKEDLSVLENVSAQISVALEHVRLVGELRDTLLSTTLSLASAIEAKSPWTRGHSERVTRYALEIASRLGFSGKEKETLRLAGLLHDIGKIGTYEAILEKPDRLTPEEMEVVKQHSMKGVEILKPIRGLEPILPLVAHHHEDYDGSGYPAGLKGDAIPLAARILTVADAYDSMTADRPYRPAPGKDYAIGELQRCAGSQFDPEVVRTFLQVMDREGDR